MSSRGFFRCPIRLFALSFAAIAFLLLGCENSNEDSLENGDSPYNITTGISDSSVALVMSSKLMSSRYGNDTMLADRYWRNLQRLKRRKYSGDQLEKAHRKLIEFLVRTHVLFYEAKKRNVDIDSARLTARLNEFKSQYESESQFREALARNNLTVDSVRSMLADRILVDRLRRRVFQQQMAENYEEPSAGEELSKSVSESRMNELMSSVTVHTQPFEELRRIGKAIEAKREARRAQKKREQRRKQEIREKYIGVYENPLGEKTYVQYGKWYSGDLSGSGLPWEVKSAEVVNLCFDTQCLQKITLSLNDQPREINGAPYNFTINGVPHRKIR